MINVLIVDDEISSVKIIQKFLPYDDYQLKLTGTAENGTDAMYYLNSPNPPDLVITDMNMPAMDGISLLQYLIDCHPDIKVIVISGYYDFEYTHAAIKAGVHDYLLKPVEPEKLAAAVANCCRKINKQKKLTVNLETKEVQIDLALYQLLLKHAKQLKEILTYGKISNIEEELSSIQKIMQTEASHSKDLCSLVYKTLADTLFQYCVEGNFPVPLIPAFQENISDNTDDVFHLIQEMYIQCFTQISDSRRKSSISDSLEPIRQYIGDHYRDNLSLEIVAELFFVNKEYLSVLFRKKYGETVGSYIIRLKMEDAKRQLEYSERSINQISESLGYVDSGYFNRQFKKTTGLTPNKYRKIYQKKTDKRR